MEMKLAEQIKDCRKARGMTQEQLAEALGVTVGAVYKWEAGRSMPEVGMLVELADLFETSVDALLGYQVRNNDCKHTVQRLKNAGHDRPSRETLLDAEKAIRKYPNHFDIVYRSAVLYNLAGVVQNDHTYQRRAMELYQKALLLIDQNTDNEISALSIQVEIAGIYFMLGENEMSIALLKENNPLGVNNDEIGSMLAVQGDTAEAATFLSKALLNVVVKQLRTVDGLLNIFEKQGEYETMIELLHWALNSIRGLQKPGVTSFLDRMETIYLTVLAYMTMRRGDRDQAAEILRQAKQVALRFDAEPNYAVNRIRFVSPDALSSAFDNFGTSALSGIVLVLKQQNDPALMALWREVNGETE